MQSTLVTQNRQSQEEPVEDGTLSQCPPHRPRSRREANLSTLKRLNEGEASGPAVGGLSGSTKLKSSLHIIKNGHPSNSATFTSKTGLCCGLRT